jgi:hypothetical protein
MVRSTSASAPEGHTCKDASLYEFAFAVAIGCKADMLFLHVR